MDNQQLDVEEVFYLDDEGYPEGLMGYWCREHLDAQQFAISCNQEFGACVHVSEVDHCWAEIDESADGYTFEVVSKNEETVPITCWCRA